MLFVSGETCLQKPASYIFSTSEILPDIQIAHSEHVVSRQCRTGLISGFMSDLRYLNLLGRQTRYRFTFERIEFSDKNCESLTTVRYPKPSIQHAIALILRPMHDPSSESSGLMILSDLCMEPAWRCQLFKKPTPTRDTIDEVHPKLNIILVGISIYYSFVMIRRRGSIEANS